MAPVRIAIVAESFLPQTNGVTVTLLRLLEFLQARGDDVLVLAPAPARRASVDSAYAGASVRRFRAVPMPGYREFRVSTPRVSTLQDHLRYFAPDVVHLAAPFLLGWQAIGAAQRLDLPTVAVYQTEVPSYARRYHAGALEPLLWKRVIGIHSRATLSLAPSSFASAQLTDRGVHRVAVWPHGVDRTRFSPVHRSEQRRTGLAPGGQTIVGYVGRLAREKQVEDLRVLGSLPGVQLVIVGDGPRRDQLRRALPGARFTGHLTGPDLSAMIASLDVFVHTGEMDTFAQTIQEAQASGVPTVAPARGGPMDLIAEGDTGYLYRPGDLPALRRVVARLSQDPQHRERLGERARASTARRTWDAVNAQAPLHYARAVELGELDRRTGWIPQWRRLPRVRRRPLQPRPQVLTPVG